MSESANRTIDSRSDASRPAIPSQLRLRAERPRVTRLSRKVLAGGAAIALVGGLRRGALGAAEQSASRRRHRTSSTAPSIAPGRRWIDRAAARLCRRPAPGAAARAGAAGRSRPADPERRRGTQHGCSGWIRGRSGSSSGRARKSKRRGSAGCLPRPIFANCLRSRRHRRRPQRRRRQHRVERDHPASTDDAFAQNGQDRKLAFVNAPVDRRTTSPIGWRRRRRPMWCRPALSSRRADHRHPLGSARPNHRPGDGKRL